MDGEVLKRLPKGYKARVSEDKQRLMKIVDSFRKSGLTFENNVKWIASVEDIKGNKTYRDIQVYEESGVKHLSFDFDIVGVEILYDTKTDRYKIFESCVVFIEGTDKFVDNYKWSDVCLHVVGSPSKGL